LHSNVKRQEKSNSITSQHKTSEKKRRRLLTWKKWAVAKCWLPASFIKMHVRSSS